MTEQITYPASATVERDGKVSVRRSEAVTGSPQAMIYLHSFTAVPPKKKSLTERFNETYDEEAKQEDEEFFKASKAYYRNRFNT